MSPKFILVFQAKQRELVSGALKKKEPKGHQKRKACKSMAKGRKSSTTFSNSLERRSILIKEAKIKNHYLPPTYALVIYRSLV